MDIRRQACQNCASRKLRNLLIREDGSPDKIYVQCLECSGLVARYIVAQQGYYHHGKDFESYLRGLNRGENFDSGKNVQAHFEEVKETALAEFEAVLKKLEETGKE